ncbi:NUDIX hydrolase [Marinibactrum halimedae]|uniref:NUDIX hydrolase n=1 Tax=Marinibactrum halimedae TaxID=1444977 RepID=A0AA37T8A6_9GAMM|nr:NUDIX domain-containing protein [Marinibactrum halimedae]MCD9458171.1 NUDIX hydrolase [Marinibactrum halimedae]GLS25105.1 NUDIX hydrolase [Marinibactrum halimedae]
MSTSESDYLQHYNIHNYDTPLCTVDMCIFSVLNDSVNVLLVKRSEHPERGKWALPGGFVHPEKDQTLDDTAYRKLFEKTGVASPYLEQVGTFGNNSRDPRGWSLTIAYFALINSSDITLSANESSERAQWVPIHELNDYCPMAFDHLTLFTHCYERLKNKVQYTSLPINLLQEEFTLSELQQLFEILLNKHLDRKAFRRRFLDADIIEETGNMRASHTRPAKLYRAKQLGAEHYFLRSIEGPRS